MGYASLKVKEEDKQLFDRLLHEVALQTGENLSQHELFHRILDQALRAKGRLMSGSGRKGKRDWTKYMIDLGEPTNAAADVDRVVYGLDG